MYAPSRIMVVSSKNAKHFKSHRAYWPYQPRQPQIQNAIPKSHPMWIRVISVPNFSYLYQKSISLSLILIFTILKIKYYQIHLIKQWL